MDPFNCKECGRPTPRTGRRQFYCLDCRAVRDKAQRAEAERRRRERDGPRIRAQARERYATDQRVNQQKREAAAEREAALRADPAKWPARLVQRRAAGQRYRNKTLYNGNAVLALLRDGYRCQACNTVGNLHIHHIDGRGCLLPVEDQNNELDNLITLCVGCHAATHRMRERLEREAEERSSS